MNVPERFLTVELSLVLWKWPQLGNKILNRSRKRMDVKFENGLKKNSSAICNTDVNRKVTGNR
jgi:hypothetical protein